MHLYSTPHSLSWIIFLENGSSGMEWSGPASYVKIRDELYRSPRCSWTPPGPGSARGFEA